ncbi:Zn-dependent hydrolase of beta-lactamase, putative [Trichomonas vaginalis G3]|uniref:Zn-dependent hydrolase of beta-lactamase, putative n=1 Tax=Trichomonas vaginalis (strain ATCC PRA-98 / G3) TaxID=412133 RepID=A2EID0_TRIV3|nr:N-acetylphosphatidylethanolamine-hydrolyzing phospholipas protein [Trichomonas vaginalis G3]EAY07612.1 Zn-dependent hydrolase of beta-lactamase, putative [Trichomonas vaginalis G3]KAI5502502.1 N-acetylphosphatidylethanolamine-hydrolyzing phospholipas protein [Trichomonas vaginalis G3]|eukprot:XP_001319835.1 Zn-dependent hydrolase of beta-lactamase [Trichomonas vaginalis G3]
MMLLNQQAGFFIPENLPTYNDAHHASGKFINNDGDPIVPLGHLGLKIVPLVFKALFAEKDVTREMPHRNPKYDFNLGDGIRDWWIGHATNLIQIKDKFIITDPMFESSCSPLKMGLSRKTPAACKIEELPRISYVLISHNHYDHLNKGSVKKIKSFFPDCHFLVPLGNGSLLSKWGIIHYTEFDWRTHLNIEGINFTCFPARHESARSLCNINKALWCSWLIEHENVKIYFTGDTAVGPHFAEIKETIGRGPDLMIAGIGPTVPRETMRVVHMDGKDAWDMAKAIGAAKLTPIHYGTFPLGRKTTKSDLDIFMEKAEAGKSLVINTGGRIDWNGSEFVVADL